MLMHDYSQSPVMSGKREVKGVISWNSIGRSLGLHAIPVDTEIRLIVWTSHRSSVQTSRYLIR